MHSLCADSMLQMLTIDKAVICLHCIVCVCVCVCVGGGERNFDVERHGNIYSA